MKQTGLQILKFGFVGLANTGVGLSVILACMYLLGFSPVSANMAGYAAGLCFSYFANSRWTFGRGASWSSGGRFLVAFAISYVMNLVVLLVCVRGVHATPLVSQIAALLTYTAVFFLLSKLFVFPDRSCHTP